MKPVRPRQLLHRGRVDAAGLFFDPAIVGESEARRRVLAQWSPGAVVFRAAGGYVLRAPSPRPVFCARAGAAPLTVLPSGALTDSPLATTERAALEPPAGAVVLVRGGQARVLRPGEGDAVDVSRWLDVGAYAESLEVESLGDPPPPPAVRVAAPAPVRQVFQQTVGSAPREFAEVVAALQARAAVQAAGGAKGERGRQGANAQAGAGTAGEASGAPPTRLPFHLALLTALRAMLLRATAFFAAPPRRPPTPDGAPPLAKNPTLTSAPAEPSGPSLIARLAAALNHALARALVATRLAQALGKRHAEYLDDVMEMFRRGDLREALRHAIPLGGAAEDGAGIDLATLLRSLGPREGLEISGTAARGGSLGLGKSLYDELREMYRAAFQKLEAEGRIEEAAFVLAELLRESEEAVAFLERHGRLEMAAKVAEARRLAPGLVVRQWFLAGDAERAVLIARQTGAFGDAVLRLENSGREGAARLRLLWARSLAAGGDYAGAAEVAWKIAPPPDELRLWVELAADGGGAVGARMLARMLATWPETYPKVLTRAQEIYAGTEPERAHERVMFLQALSNVPHARERAVLARVAARSLVHAAALTGDSEVGNAATQAVGLTADPLLRADLPTWSTFARQPLATRPSPLSLTLPATDGGTMRVYDAALLPDGRTLVALGEAGLRLLTRDGRTVVHLDEPAHRLVVSDHGDRAIAVAERAQGYRLARVDVRARRAAAWAEAKLGAFAANFDGSSWVVGVGADLCAVDALAEGFTLLRKVVDMGTGVAAIARDVHGCAVLSEGDGEHDAECWRFESAGWVLRGRSAVKPSTDPVVSRPGAQGYMRRVSAAASNGAWVSLRLGLAGPVVLERGGEGSTRATEVQPGRAEGRFEAVWADGPWVACAFGVANGVRVCLYDAAQLAPRANLVLGGAMRAFARFGQGALVLGDDRGRVLALDLRTGSYLRDLRV